MPHSDILHRMAESPVIFDGAMGTMIYNRGVFLNRCFDEICLSDPRMIEDIHRQYIKAGAEVIETNTFGATRNKLRAFNLGESVERINREAARIARSVAGDDAYVAGSVGPCLEFDQVLTEDNRAQARACFEESIGALVDGGVDLLLLETFSDPEEIDLALGAASQTGLPTLVCFTVAASGETVRGTFAEDIVRRLDADTRVGAIGLNCGAGPAPLHSTVERVIGLTAKPFVVMPNAGLPQVVEGRMIYLATPEYFTSYAKRFIQLGARGVGGCCGTTPEHIRMMARAVRSLSGVKKHVAIQVYERPDIEVQSVPMGTKSRFGEGLANGRRVSCVELLPPKSVDLTSLLEKARQCHIGGVDAINIPDGPRASARVSPMIAALAIQQQVGIETVLHYCCRDRNLIGIQSDLLGGYAAGLRNFLIITGDPPKIGDYPDVTGVFDIDAIGLTQITCNLNRGLDIGGNVIKPPTAILIGVGCNPSAIEMHTEIDRFRRKIEAGAEFAVTQPVFDAEALLRFLDATSPFRTIPIVAGVWPLTSYKNAEFLKNEVPGVDVPDHLLERMRGRTTREDSLKEGVQIAQEICERIQGCVAGFQVSAPFGNVDLAMEILSAVVAHAPSRTI